MATWKERGEVPDSDDDEDFETLSNFSQEDQNNEARFDEVQRFDGPTEYANNGIDTDGNASREEEAEENDDGSELPEALVSTLDGGPSTSLVNEITGRPGSLESLNNLEFPPLWFETEPQNRSGLDDVASNLQTHLNGHMHLSDGVSKSYVQITSVASSPPSSLLESLPSLLTSVRSSRNLGTDSRKRKEVSNQGGLGINMNIDLEEPPVAKRTFRQRTGIQLHPYGIEQEKYRRTLRERGIIPTTIAESQERRRASTSADPDSQQLGSQNLDSDDGFIATEESQPMDNLSSPPKKYQMPLQSQDLDEVLNHREPIGSDDEFPDIDALLQQTQVVFPSSSVKRRPKTYTAKSKRPTLANIRTGNIARQPSQRQSSIFDVPASPPATSSPFPALNRRTISRTTSTSSKAPTPRQRANDHHGGTIDIPTPATSAVKPTPMPAPVYVDSESEIEHPFPGCDEATESASSSSDESLLIRRVGKKIRGVLPASHLRLDLKRKNPTTPHQNRHFSRSVSPVGTFARPGVALPTTRKNTQGPSVPSSGGLGFLEDLSDEEDEEEELLSVTQNQDTGLGSLFAQSRVGYAEEDDSIDAMLPSRKRPGIPSKSRPSKRTKTGLLIQRRDGSFQRQPKITEHLAKPPVSKIASRKHGGSGPSRRKKRGVSSRKIEKPTAPELSILDVTDTISDRNLPWFIRVAARTAKTRKRHGRQSPTRKFIRLANRKDTADAQSVLQEWKDGKILPKDLTGSHRGSHHTSLRTIQGSESIQQTRLRSPVKKFNPQQTKPPRHLGMPRRLVISNGAQQSMDVFVTPQEGSKMHDHSPKMPIDTRRHPMQKDKRRNAAAPFRPAQLEAKELGTSSLPPLQSFRSSKNVLDVLYQASRKRAVPKLPLSRFLADDDIPHPFPETSIETPDLEVDLPLPTTEPRSRLVQRRKRQPQRIDIGAAEYRQPNNTLILNFAPVVVQNAESNATKLLGLGKYGTHYPINFDIYPLPPGVFFHESTFVGSGRLAEVLKDVGSDWYCPGPHRTSMSLLLGTKQFCWGTWNENVSSEIGICFDWIVDQSSAEAPAISSSPTINAIDVLDFISRYIQESATFTETRTLHDFLSRMIGVLDDFFCRLNNKEPPSIDSQTRYVRIMGRCASLCLQLVLISKSAAELSPLTFDLEALLQKIVRGCIKVLIAHGLKEVRELYDNLQYLSFRERGIRSDAFAIEAWVIILKLLNKARIPRGSFLDVVNSVLLTPDSRNTQDASVMENLWYSIFSLLPLSEFDDFGVVIPEARHTDAFDNWVLPQQMLKRVFELYGSNQRQSPSFNDYCRSIVSRCHYLMVEWGWWKCSGVIGTLFDFFASHNLAHLRNEEVYSSPHFLQELHLDPSLPIEPEDRCFHIFLKIVALGVKHLEKINNEKGVRNLIARILPNHDRQYPKEEEVRQRDLASLRNHHDLLCTLYWAAPPQQRPPPSLIQKLVIPERSHTQACLINIRAWENLARFVLANNPTYDSYLPFSVWQRTLLNALWEQYQNTEAEVRSQADSLSANNLAPISEAQIMETIMGNQTEVINVLDAMIHAIRNATNGSMKISIAKEYINTEFLGQVLDHATPLQQLSTSTIQILQYYIWMIRNPVDEPGAAEDTQDSQLGGAVLDRFEALVELAECILGPLQRHLQRLVASRQVERDPIDCWANLISLLMEENILKLALPCFVGDGKYAIVDHKKFKTAAEKHFWWQFLLALITRSSEFPYSIPSFDFGSEWLKILAMPPTPEQRYIGAFLSAQLYEHEYCLLHDPITVDGEVWSRTDQRLRRLFHNLGLENTIKLALCSMKDMVKSGSEVAKELCKGQLQDLMSSMEENLRSMVTGTYAGDLRHDEYVELVQRIVGDIHIYCSHIQQLPPFFRTASKCYWPSRSDPLMFIENSKHLSLELAGENPDGTASTLFYYLVLSLDEAMAKDDLRKHTSNLGMVLETREHLKFVLKELVTPMLDTAFQIEAGWVLCSSYLPNLAAVLSNLFLDNRAKAFAFRWATKVIDTIMFDLEIYQDEFKDSLTGCLVPRFQHILAILFHFCNTLRTGMVNHTAEWPAERPHFDATQLFLENMARNIDLLNKGKTPTSRVSFPTALTPSMGVYYEKFGPDMKEHVDKSWTVEPGGKYLTLKKNGKKAQLLKSPDLGKVLAQFTEKGPAARFLGGAERFFGKM